VKMWPVCTMLAAAALLLGTARPGSAGRSPSGTHGEHGAVHSPDAWGPGSHGHAGVRPRSTLYSDLRGPEASPHHPFVHDHFRGHPEVRTRIVVGPGVWWGEPWWWGPPYLYYAAPPVLVQEAPPVSIEQEPPPPQVYYWYYCQNPPGYYPYVKDCPAGWMTVVPPMGAGRAGAGETRRSFFTYEGPLITIILSHGQELGLTPGQLQELQALRTAFEKEAAPRGAAIRAAEADLNALLAKGQWDLPAIEAKVQHLATLQGDLRVATIKTLAAGRALLTPEQLQKLEAIGQWTPPPAGPERMGPRPPSGPGGPPTPRQ
jgi:Spy/CpxP family protein refolding chaperone